MNQKEYFRPVIPLLLFFISGIILGDRFPGFGAPACVIIAFCIILLFVDIYKKKGAYFSPPALFLFLGYLSILRFAPDGLPDNHIINFSSPAKYTVVGVIDNKPEAFGKRLKFNLDTRSLSKNDEFIPVQGKIRVTVSGNYTTPKRGNTVRFYGRIRRIKNFSNPGGFDYKRYMAFQGIRAASSTTGKRLEILSRKHARFPWGPMADAREAISGLIDKAAGKNERGILKALLIGEKNGISKAAREAFARAGVAHILAISGLHVGIVAGGFFVFFKYFLSFFPALLWNASANKWAALLSIFPIIGYGLLAGMQPSTQRAVIMVSAFMAALIFEKENNSVNTLSVAALIILVLSPESLFSVSFQLSFAAVFTILYGISIRKTKAFDHQKNKKSSGFKPGQKFLSFIFISILAIIGTAPVVSFYFNQVSPAGILVNCIVVPVIGFIVVPLCLASVVLYPFSFFVSFLCIKTAGFVLDPVVDLVFFFSSLPFAAIKTVTPSCFEILCYYVLIISLIHLIFSPKRRKLFVFVIIFIIIAGCGDLFYWFNKRIWHDDLKVTILDVGQGSSALLEFPDGYTMLIDGGGFSDNSMFDMGARILAPFLWKKKIKTVDTLVLSHADSDHLNGLLYIAQHFNVKNVWSNNETADKIGYRNFLEIIEKEKINAPKFNLSPRKHTINGVELSILYPPKNFINMKKNDRWRNSNNDSIVIKVKFGKFFFLFPGDIEAKAEQELVSTMGNDLQSTVLIAPHHGSKTSSTEIFLQKVKPEIVIVSSGSNYRFNFPDPLVIKRYLKLGYRIFSTSVNGAVTITTDGKELDVEVFKVKAE